MDTVGGQTAYYNTRPVPGYFPDEQFNRQAHVSPVVAGRYSPPPPPACIYAEKAAAAAAAAQQQHQNGYGGSPMAVVESCMDDVGLVTTAAQYPRMPHHSNMNMMALANMSLPQEGSAGAMCSPSCVQVSPAVSMPQCSASAVSGATGTMTDMTGHHQRHLHHPQNMSHLNTHHNGATIPPPGCGHDVKPRLIHHQDNGGRNLPFPWMKTTKSHAHMWKANWPGKYQIKDLAIKLK